MSTAGSKFNWLYWVTAAALIALVAVFYLRVGPHTETSAKQSSEQSKSSNASELPSPRAPQSAQTPTRTSSETKVTFSPEQKLARALPPLETPLAIVYEELKSMASSGNYRAACRLSAEMNRCRTIDVSRGVYEADKADLAKLKPGSTQYIEQEKVVATSEAQYRSDSKVCEGFPMSETKEAWRYLLMAAEAGHVPSMTRFAVNPPLEEQAFNTDLDAWQVYRQVAPQLLVNAVANGDTSALYAYAAYLDGKLPAPGGPLYQRDPVKSYAMTLLLTQLANNASKVSLNKRLKRLSNEIGPAGIIRAEAESSNMAIKFAGKKEVSFVGGLTMGDHPRECLE